MRIQFEPQHAALRSWKTSSFYHFSGRSQSGGCGQVGCVHSTLWTLILNVMNPLTINVPNHIETSQVICFANQLIGFYTMGTPVVHGLTSSNALKFSTKFWRSDYRFRRNDFTPLCLKFEFCWYILFTSFLSMY